MFHPQIIKYNYWPASLFSSCSPPYQFKMPQWAELQVRVKQHTWTIKQKTNTSLEHLQWSTNDTGNSVTIKQPLVTLQWELPKYEKKKKKEQKKEEETQENSSDSSYKRTAVTSLYFGEDFIVTSFRLSEHSQDTHYSTICWSVSIALKAQMAGICCFSASITMVKLSRNHTNAGRAGIMFYLVLSPGSFS